MFPRILKELRRRKSVTQIQLAAAIGVSPGNVGDWETGKSCPSYNALIALSNFFGVSADTLLGLDVDGRDREVLVGREADLVSMIRQMDDRDREDIYGLVSLKYQRASQG